MPVIEHEEPYAGIRDARRRDAIREGMRLARERAERDAEVRADAEDVRESLEADDA